jgi:hypothetical protein
MPPFRCLSLLVAAIAAWAFACGPADPVNVQTSTLEIMVVTSGDEADADGYTVQVDNQSSRAIGPSDVFQDREITPGDHTIYVGGVAANCRVEGANPRTVSVPAQGTISITIRVLCGVRLGSVLVGIRTHGPATYPAPYIVAIDGVEAAAVDTGRVLLENVNPGPHVIELRRVPEHCTAHGNHFRITVRPAEITAVEIFVSCVGLHGTLVITTLASGLHLPDNFIYTVDGKRPTPIAPVDAHTLAVNSGDHAVELLQVPTNCSVQQPNPNPVHVPPGGRGQVIFTIRCDRT